MTEEYDNTFPAEKVPIMLEWFDKFEPVTAKIWRDMCQAETIILLDEAGNRVDPKDVPGIIKECEA